MGAYFGESQPGFHRSDAGHFCCWRLCRCASTWHAGAVLLNRTPGAHSGPESDHDCFVTADCHRLFIASAPAHDLHMGSPILIEPPRHTLKRRL
jgi:hypothetical protein